MKTLGLYIHIPWCIQKCPYCDFNSHAVKRETPEQNYVTALLQDLQQDLTLLHTGHKVGSIFIGGGTPSLFSAHSIERLLQGVEELIPLEDNLEITLEANPGTFESQKFADYRAIGVNRLSIGIQSFNNAHLKRLGRIHSAEEAIAAVEIAQQAGFDNLNLDLMFGLPDQSAKQMLSDVQTAINLNPSHISFYQLTLEPNTYFHKFPPKLPDDEHIYAAQKQAQTLLADAGYLQYEISAYAKKNMNCQHNTNYWQFGNYLGIGAGAHGKLDSISTENFIRTVKYKSPEQYLKDTTAAINKIPEAELPLEYLMNQLRLKSGFNLDHYTAVTGLTEDSLQPALSTCINSNLLKQKQRWVYCSEKGWDFIDHILEQFMTTNQASE